MRNFTIRNIETHGFSFDLLKTKFYVDIKPNTRTTVNSFSNANRSNVSNTIVESTLYTVKGKTYGSSLCNAWENFETVKKDLALPNGCRETFDIKWDDYCGNMRRDKVSLFEPIRVTSPTMDDKCALIIEYEFTLISDHKGFYGDIHECCVNKSMGCGNKICNTLVDECGKCKPLFNPSGKTIINYNGSISTYPNITVKGVSKNFKAINITNGSRIDISGEIRDLVMEQGEYGYIIKSNDIEIKNQRKIGLGLELSPGDNEIVFFDDSGNDLDICLSRYDTYL